MVATITRTTRPPWRVFFCPLSEAPPIGAGKNRTENRKETETRFSFLGFLNFFLRPFFEKKEALFFIGVGGSKFCLGCPWVSAERHPAYFFSIYVFLYIIKNIINIYLSDTQKPKTLAK